MFGKGEEIKKSSRNPILADRQGLALIVVDLQEKFAPVIPNFDGIVKNAVALIKTFQMFELPVLVSEQYPQGLGKTVAPISDCFPIMEVTEKVTFSCAQTSQFLLRLDALKIKKVVVCGIESHVCVHQTVHDLLHRDYWVYAVGDACGSRNPDNHKLAMNRMAHAGAIPTSTEMLLFEMAFQAGTESFKRIQDLIK